MQGGRTWAAVQWDAALMNENRSGHLEQRGISLHLVPWGAVLCRGMTWFALIFSSVIWTDGAAFYRRNDYMKLHHNADERNRKHFENILKKYSGSGADWGNTLPGETVGKRDAAMTK